MTLSVYTNSGAATQAYQAVSSTNSSNTSAADTAFSVAAGSEPLFGSASSGSTLNSSLLGALLGMNGNASASNTATPNSATAAPESSSGTATSTAHHHHGLSAYVAQLANNSGSTAG